MTRARRAVVVELVRTPFGRGRTEGALAGEHPVDLLAGVLSTLVERSGIDAARVDDVIAGCSLPVGEQSGNIARHALLAAGMPESVPGVSIDRKCGSFQQALHFAAQGVIAGSYDVAVASGVEMMSTVPMRTNRMGRDDQGPRLRARYPDGLVSQGISAELIASRYGLSRPSLDAFALRSHQRAAAAQDEGRVARYVVPVIRGDGKRVDADEGIRRTTSLAALERLRPAFQDPEMQERFPEIDWRVTAGNSSPVTDGAAATLVVEESLAHRWGLRPLAAITGGTVVGDDPILMLMGVVPATRKLLDRAGVRADGIDRYEVNEAFASVVLAWQKNIAVDPETVNVDGGAIAYGHPIGASGARLLAGLIEQLQIPGVDKGVMTMCESGAMANATLLEAPQ
ncbi:acetyl-CoA acetyltransferase [Nocardioides sp. Soil777]|uniref:thiolase family protein n=1 Tax=Nocardioides sp. Soil777 TaxID=1736409 RepID=UPI0007023E27|nr:thiolase family protein [Nocardioides sp. Soil777]KRF05424.1 acetyl-CoA acetyltransferase [Nocardioides sp. Soil777]